MEKKEINHVLIVEDDKEIREGVEIYLRSQGYEVFQAADGIEGLAVVEKEEIHLAIVDVMMPRMDGIQMTIKLREKHDFPVIFLSAKSEEVDKILLIIFCIKCPNNSDTCEVFPCDTVKVISHALNLFEFWKCHCNYYCYKQHNKRNRNCCCSCPLPART